MKDEKEKDGIIHDTGTIEKTKCKWAMAIYNEDDCCEIIEI